MKIKLVYFILAQFHTKKAMSQSPCFDIWYWIWKEPQTIHVYKIDMEQNTKQFYCIADKNYLILK